MDNVTFYKFVDINDVDQLKKEILENAKSLNIKGKILLAKEGINGYISGSKENIKLFEEYMQSIEEFKDVWFKHNPTQRFNSKRMLVKVRKEIITFKQDYNMKNTGKYISPEELDKLYENKEDFVIVDTRNDYEYDIGHFKGAVKLNTKEFTDFPEEIEKIRENAKSKKIITYCTGGVRCEKATAYMKENGFEDVYQLEGGIINYGIERGENNWEGRCFVFDDRGAIRIDPKEQEKDEYVQCSICFVPEENTHSCLNCGKEFVICDKCNPLLEGCCSKFCRNEIRFRKSL